jgi:hypothetical protein
VIPAGTTNSHVASLVSDAASNLTTRSPVVALVLSLGVGPLMEHVEAACAFVIDGPTSFETNPAIKARDRKTRENFFIRITVPKSELISHVNHC